MSKRNKLIIIGAAVLVVIIALSVGLGVGLSNKKKHPGSIKYKAEVTLAINASKLAQFNLITSTKELNSLFGDEYNDTYNNKFFRNKSLIVMRINEPSGSCRYEVNDVFIEDNVLYIDLIKIHGFGTQVPYTWMILIEVRERDIQGITDIDKIITDVYDHEE